MIEIPVNEVQMDDYENVVSDVLSQLASGEAFVDWGAISDVYQNCPSRSLADRVARDFKAKGYYVYIQKMGMGHPKILVGTPVTYRIHKKARVYNTWDEL